MYKLLISKQVTKFIFSRKKKERQLIKSKLEELILNPYASPTLDIKKIKGKNEFYRLRIGKYRFIYEIRQNQLIVIMLTAGNRGDIYKK